MPRTKLGFWEPGGPSSRSRHLVFLIHVWVCAPFLIWWIADPRVRTVLGPEATRHLTPVVGGLLVYLAIRTVAAIRNIPPRKWEIYFPPIDVIFVSLLLGFSDRGPMSNLSLLYLLPIIEAAGSLRVRWALAVAGMAVVGLSMATLGDWNRSVQPSATDALALINEERMNVAFRIFYLFLVASLLGFQSRLATELRARLNVAEDRARIAADMHDGVQGRLIALAQVMELVDRVAERDPKRARELALDGANLARSAADELRFLVGRLRSPELNTDGFVPALRQYLHNLGARAGLDVRLVVHGDPVDLPPETENALFRIAQEALTNVVKHAEATRVETVFSVDAEGASLVIADDGKGLSQAALTGVGLTSMRERAEKLRGRLRLESPASGGARLEAWLPRN